MQFNAPKYVRQILFGLQSRGHSAYVVGGCVRDIIMGVQPNDWDICTSAHPEEVLELFPGSRPTGIKHGTVTVVIGNHTSEVTTFRSDGEYRDHRRPEAVTFVSDLISDLSRRDFTMNAIALSADGLISDPFGGIQDIQNKTIKCVGVPKLRFTEDALRMFRALRFSARLGFTIEYETLNAITDCAPLASGLAPERVRDELEKIMMTDRPDTLGAAVSFGLLDRYVRRSGQKLPPFAELAGVSRKPLYRWIVFADMLRCYGLVPDAHELLASLRLDGRTLRCCRSAVEITASPPPDSAFGWKKLLNAYGVDAVCCAVAIYEAIHGIGCEKELKAVLNSGECFTFRKLAVTGDDLLSLGLKGHALGEMLKFLLEYVMEYPQNNRREILLELAKYSEES